MHRSPRLSDLISTKKVKSKAYCPACTKSSSKPASFGHLTWLNILQLNEHQGKKGTHDVHEKHIRQAYCPACTVFPNWDFFLQEKCTALCTTRVIACYLQCMQSIELLKGRLTPQITMKVHGRKGYD